MNRILVTVFSAFVILDSGMSLAFNSNEFSDLNARALEASYGPGPTTGLDVTYWVGPGHSLGPDIGPSFGPCIDPSMIYGPVQFELTERTRFEQSSQFDRNKPGEPASPQISGAPDCTVTLGPGVTLATPSAHLSGPISFNDNWQGITLEVGPVRDIRSEESAPQDQQREPMMLPMSNDSLNRNLRWNQLGRLAEARNRSGYDIYGISLGICYKNLHNYDL